mmetsp:Transcript_34232/g.51329  ORF Transcript_34232/g.51329 Transcript_34232/m.51329 type:complete len:142 (+) Transcript_34232:1807-2232(+)
MIYHMQIHMNKNFSHYVYYFYPSNSIVLFLSIDDDRSLNNRCDLYISTFLNIVALPYFCLGLPDGGRRGGFRALLCMAAFNSFDSSSPSSSVLEGTLLAELDSKLSNLSVVSLNASKATLLSIPPLYSSILAVGEMNPRLD